MLLSSLSPHSREDPEAARVISPSSQTAAGIRPRALPLAGEGGLRSKISASLCSFSRSTCQGVLLHTSGSHAREPLCPFFNLLTCPWPAPLTCFCRSNVFCLTFSQSCFLAGIRMVSVSASSSAGDRPPGRRVGEPALLGRSGLESLQLRCSVFQ